MQLLYGNDGTNYHTIAKSNNLVFAQEQELLKGYVRYSFVDNSNKYSSVKNEPISLAYVTTNLANTLAEDMILLVQNARMTNYLTPSYYSHVHLLKVSEEMYGGKFFDLLQYAFIKDVNVNSYLQGEIDTFTQEKKSDSVAINTDAIEKEKVFPILAQLLDVADSMSQQVKLILDVEGDEYNRRALEVVATLYSYLPYNIRKSVGFITYTSADEVVSSRIKLRLYPRDAIGKLGADAIDLLNFDAEKVVRNVSQEAIQLAKAILEKDVMARENLFNSFRLAFLSTTASVADHCEFYKYIDVWKFGKLEAIKDDLAKYAYIEKQGNSPLYRVFRTILNERFRTENFNIRYNEIIKELLERQNDFKFDNKIKAYIVLGEEVDSLSFSSEMFTDWLEKGLIERALSKYEDLNLFKYVKKESVSMRQNLNFAGKKFDAVVQDMDKYINDWLNTVKSDVYAKIKKEEERFAEYFASKDFSFNKEILDREYERIAYVENQTFFREKLKQQFMDRMGGFEYFRSYDIYESFKKSIHDCCDYLDEDAIKELMDILEKKGEIVKAMETIKLLEWNGKKDILESYNSIAKMHAVSDGYNVEVPDYQVALGRNIYDFSEVELIQLIKILLCYERVDQSVFQSIVYRHINIVRDLCSIKAFGEEHYQMLISSSSDNRAKEFIIRYYINEDIMLSEDIIKNSIEEYDYKLASDILRGYNPRKNLLYISLLQKVKEHDEQKRARYIENVTSTSRDDYYGGSTFQSSYSENKEKASQEKNEKQKQGKEYWVDSDIVPHEIVLLGTLIPSIIFAVVAIFVAFLANVNLALPIAFTVISIVISIICYIVGRVALNELDSKCIGGILGGVLSIIATWISWIIF